MFSQVFSKKVPKLIVSTDGFFWPKYGRKLYITKLYIGWAHHKHKKLFFCQLLVNPVPQTLWPANNIQYSCSGKTFAQGSRRLKPERLHEGKQVRGVDVLEGLSSLGRPELTMLLASKIALVADSDSGRLARPLTAKWPGYHGTFQKCVTAATLTGCKNAGLQRQHSHRRVDCSAANQQSVPFLQGQRQIDAVTRVTLSCMEGKPPQAATP